MNNYIDETATFTYKKETIMNNKTTVC